MATGKYAKRDPTPVFDRTPPQNIDAERAVLGAMLINADAVGTVIETLPPRDDGVFYVPAHQAIFDAIVELFRENKAVDSLTVSDKLADADALESVGGLTYLGELTQAVPTSAGASYYAEIVRDASVLRRIILTCTELVSEAYTAQGEVTDLLDKTEEQIFSIAQDRIKSPIVGISDLIVPTVKKIEEIMETKSGITGLPTGFQRLDTYLSGLQPSDMIVLAARPSVGKTAFALNIAANAAVKHGKGCLLFSLEMSKEQLAMRLFCMEGRIDSGKLRSGFLAHQEFAKLQRAADALNGTPIFIDDTPGLTPLDLRAKARRHAAKHPLDLIVIDYLQLMSASGRQESRQTEIAAISRTIKAVARELSIPVLALSQLSREAEKDDTGQPKLSHLRESGAIEQDADVVLMLSRPPAHEREEKPNNINLNIAKQRNGPTGNCEMMFDRAIQRFGDIDRQHEDEPADMQYSEPDAAAAGPSRVGAAQSAPR